MIPITNSSHAFQQFLNTLFYNINYIRSSVSSHSSLADIPGGLYYLLWTSCSKGLVHRRWLPGIPSASILEICFAYWVGFPCFLLWECFSTLVYFLVKHIVQSIVRLENHLLSHPASTGLVAPLFLHCCHSCISLFIARESPFNALLFGSLLGVFCFPSSYITPSCWWTKSSSVLEKVLGRLIF